MRRRPRPGCCAAGCRASKRTLPASTGAPPAACAIACARAGVRVAAGTGWRFPATPPPSAAGCRAVACATPSRGQRQVALEDLDARARGPISGPARRCPAPAPPHAGRRRRRARTAATARTPAQAARPDRAGQPARAGRAPASRPAAASTSVRPGTPTQAAGWMKMSPKPPGTAQTLPHGFHGKAGGDELARQVGQHPGAGQRSSARASPAGPAGRPAQATAMNGASTSADRRHRQRHQPPVARRLDQDRLGDPVQPEQVVREAEPEAAPQRACPPRRAPSISASRPGTASSSTGSAWIGGSASADSSAEAGRPASRAPAAQAAGQNRPGSRLQHADGTRPACISACATIRSGGTVPPVSAAAMHSAAITPIVDQRAAA